MKDFADNEIAGVRLVEAGSALDSIHDPDCAAVIWARPACAALFEWLSALPQAQLPQAREILHRDAVRPALARILAPLPDHPQRIQLAQDIAIVADQFAVVMRAPWLRLRLDVVTGDACRKFHVDNVTARLVCTYRGTGTQYGLAARGSEPEVIATVPAGQPIVLRGACWPTTPPSLLKHRSPPIAGTGETRLLLVLDPVMNPADEI